MSAVRDDAELLRAWSARHEEQAFQALCGRHAAFVAAVCRRLGSPDADEAAQAVFLVLARRAGDVEGPRLLGWLSGTARRVVAGQRLATQRRHAHEEKAAMERICQVAEPLHESAWDDVRGLLDEALASLSAGRRDAVMRFYLEGKPAATVAAELGCSIDAVRTRVHEGLHGLRSFFARRGHALSIALLISGLSSESAGADPALAEACAQAVTAQAASSSGVAALAASVGSASQAGGMAAATGAICLAVAVLAVLTVPMFRSLAAAGASPPAPAATGVQARLFIEGFDDDRFAERGWYDGPDFLLRTAEGCTEFRFAAGSQVPTGGRGGRRLFTPAPAVTIRYRIRHLGLAATADADVGVYHCMVLTDADGAWSPPSSTRLTCAIGVWHGLPFISLRDASNLDTSRIGQDLVGQTEDRAVHGGNGDSDGTGFGVYVPLDDGSWWNEKLHPAEAAAMPAGYRADAWHSVAIDLRLNRVVDGVALADGGIRFAIDGHPVIDRQRMVLRTARNAAMRFNQVLLVPTTRGSEREQAFQLDDFEVVAREVP